MDENTQAVMDAYINSQPWLNPSPNQELHVQQVPSLPSPSVAEYDPSGHLVLCQGQSHINSLPGSAETSPSSSNVGFLSHPRVY
jgi:hypothetical protein